MKILGRNAVQSAQAIILAVKSWDELTQTIMNAQDEAARKRDDPFFKGASAAYASVLDWMQELEKRNGPLGGRIR